MKHFSVYLPDPVYEQLRTRAFEERQSMSQIIVRALTGAGPPLTGFATPKPQKRRKKGDK